MIFKANYKTGSKFTHKQMENVFSMQDLIATVIVKVVRRPLMSSFDILIAMYNQMMNINHHIISDGDLFMFVVSLKNGEKFTVSLGDSKSEVYKLNLDNPIVRTLTNHLRGKDPGYIAILPDVFSNKNHSSPEIIKSVFESFM